MCGVNDNAIQRRLLAESKLTYAKAMEIAQGLEAASKDVQELHGQKESGAIPVCKVYERAGGRKHPPENRRNPDKKKQSGKVCFRCGKEDRSPSQCPFKDSKCF